MVYLYPCFVNVVFVLLKVYSNRFHLHLFRIYITVASNVLVLQFVKFVVALMFNFNLLQVMRFLLTLIHRECGQSKRSNGGLMVAMTALRDLPVTLTGKIWKS